MQNVLELKNVTKRYPDFALKGLNLTLPGGCIMGFVGENGAGKSTTIHLILDLLRRDEGEIYIFGEDNRKGSGKLREHIGTVFDECCFPEVLSAGEIQVMMRGLFRTWDTERFDTLLNRFQLPLHKAIKDYSRGMKMKLSIAVALSHDSKLLILDEATSGLDPLVRDEILDVFLEFIQDEGHSILVSSHIVSDLEKICDYIALLHRGELLFCEPKDELLERYGLLKCTKSELALLAPDATKGVRENSFGVEALVDRRKVPSTSVVDRVNLEDIMLYFIKGGASI